MMQEIIAEKTRKLFLHGLANASIVHLFTGGVNIMGLQKEFQVFQLFFRCLQGLFFLKLPESASCAFLSGAAPSTDMVSG